MGLGICVSVCLCYSAARQSPQKEQRDMQMTPNKEREYAAIPADQEQSMVEDKFKQKVQELLGKWKVVHEEGAVYYDNWADENFAGTIEKDEVVLVTKVEHDGENPYGFVVDKGWIPIGESSWNEWTRRLDSDEARQHEAVAKEKKRVEVAEEADRKAEEEKFNKLAE